MNNKNSIDEKLVKTIIFKDIEESKNNNISSKVTDDEFGEKEKRNKSYSNLVLAYEQFITRTISYKFWARIIASLILGLVFLVIIGICLGIVIFVLPDMLKNGNQNQIESIITTVSIVITLVSTIIVLPRIIIEFIFNKEEDQYIIDLIKHTQDFDNDIKE